MADYTPVAADVQQSSTAIVRSGTAGATITAGMVLYKDLTDSNKLKAAVCTSATAYKAVGIALNGASDGQPIDYVEQDESFDPGFDAAIGDIAILSVAGAMCPSTDLAQGDRTVICGVFNSTSTMAVSFSQYNRSSAAKA